MRQQSVKTKIFHDFSKVDVSLFVEQANRQLFQFVRVHTRKQQVRISITCRVNALRCRLPEYLIALNITVFDRAAHV